MTYDFGHEGRNFPHKCFTQTSELTGDAFPPAVPNLPFPPPADLQPALPFNPSEYGVVHLAPVPSKSSSVDGSSQGSGSRRRSQNSPHSTAPSSQNKRKHPDSGLLSSDAGSGSEGQSQYFTGDSESESGSGSGSRGAGSAEERSSGSSASPVSMRYQHVEDENGNYLMVGREGQLTKCEEEPIRTPGAVQGFGVLIAIDEDNENGNLIVRQVSEVNIFIRWRSLSYADVFHRIRQNYLASPLDSSFLSIVSQKRFPTHKPMSSGTTSYTFKNPIQTKTSLPTYSL